MKGLEVADDLLIVNDRNRIRQSAHGDDLVNIVLKHEKNLRKYDSMAVCLRL